MFRTLTKVMLVRKIFLTIFCPEKFVCPEKSPPHPLANNFLEKIYNLSKGLFIDTSIKLKKKIVLVGNVPPVTFLMVPPLQ